MTASLKHSVASALAGVLLSSHSATSQEADGASSALKNAVILPFVSVVGEASGVNSNVDTSYTDFYLLGIEPAKPGSNINVAESNYLDPQEAYYLVTALRAGSEQTISRKFLITRQQLMRLNLPKRLVERAAIEKVGASDVDRESKILTPKYRFDFPSLGQYLRSSGGLVDFQIYPRAVAVIIHNAAPRDLERINHDLETGNVNSDYRVQPNFQLQ